MAFDWKQAASASGNEFPKLEVGDHKCTIKGVRRWDNKEGEPNLIINYADHTGAEATQFINLVSDGHSLANLLQHVEPEIDLAAVTAAGITPAHFADIEFARRQFVEKQRTVFVRVEHGSDKHGSIKTDKDGKPRLFAKPIPAAFARVNTAPTAPASAAAPTAAARPQASRPVADEELPF